MDSQGLVDVNGDKIVVSVASTGSKGQVNLGRLGKEALNSADVRLALLCAEIGPARGGCKLRGLTMRLRSFQHTNPYGRQQ